MLSRNARTYTYVLRRNFSCGSVRYSSSSNTLQSQEILEILSEIKGADSVDAINTQRISKILGHPLILSSSVDPLRSQKLAKLIQEKGSVTHHDLSSFYNIVISGFAREDYSLAAVAKNSMAKLPESHNIPDISAFVELLKYNPGRVLTSWEIFRHEIHENETLKKSLEDDLDAKARLLEVMIEKLLYGDACDIEDGFVCDSASLSKIFYIINWALKSELKLSSNVEEYFVDSLLKLHCPWIINYLVVSPETLQNKLINDKLSDLEFAVLFTNLWKQLEQMASYELLLRSLPRLASLSLDGVQLTTEESKTLEEFVRQVNKLESSSVSTAETLKELTLFNESDFETLWKDVISIIKANKLDSGDIPEAIKLKSALVQAVGIYKNDLDQAELIFDHYSGTETSSIDQLQSVLSIVYCYHSCISGEKRFIDLANLSLREFTKVPTKNIQALILAYAHLKDPQSSLDLFNKHIRSLSKEVDQSTGISPAGSATESLILGYLYNLDREFAYLINDGATENGVFKGDVALIRAKNLFKLYGAAFEEEDDSKAQEIIGRHLLDSLKKL